MQVNWQNLPVVQPAVHEGLQGGAAPHRQEELQDYGQAMKKSKLFNSCGGIWNEELSLKLPLWLFQQLWAAAKSKNKASNL